MSYLVTLSFDLHEDSSSAKLLLPQALSAIGLNAKLTGSSGKTHDLPTNTYVGTFEGESVSKVRDDLKARIESVFDDRKIKARIFLTVGRNWAWSVRDS